jgi:cytochrome c553
MESVKYLASVSAVALVAAIAFAAWASSEDHARGRELFRLCEQCHGPAGGGNQAFLAPAIAGLDEWYVQAQLEKFKSGVRGTHPEDVGGLRMYPMSLSLKNEANIKAVAGYVASLPRTDPQPVLEGGDPAHGAELYAVCMQCHGPEGAGNETLNAPRLAGASDWYLLSSLEKFKAGIRGGNPQNQTAMLMRGMSLTLPDQQAMKDVIAHIETFQD